MAILSKAYKPDNFEWHEYLKLSFMNIQSRRSNFVELEIFSWIKISWHSCSVWGRPGWLNWFWQFLWKRLSSFNLKGLYYSYAWSHKSCEGRPFFCTGLFSRKLSTFLLMLSWLALLQPLSYLFFLYRSTSWSLWKVFDSLSSNIDEVLSINPSAVFVFGDFNVHDKVGTGLPILVELTDLMNSVNPTWPYSDG